MQCKLVLDAILNSSHVYRVYPSSAESTSMNMDTERQQENSGLSIKLVWTFESDMCCMLSICTNLVTTPRRELQTPGAITAVPFPRILHHIHHHA